MAERMLMRARARRAAELARAADLAQPNPVREKELEAKDKENAMQGIVADLVLIYPIETAEEMKTEEARKEFDKRQERRADLIYSLEKARLMVQKNPSRDGKFMYIKVWATLELLIEKASQEEMEMLVRQDGMPVTLTATSDWGDKIQLLVPKFFKLEEVAKRNYRDFVPDAIDDYERKNGRLFSSLERQRLIYGILEGTEESGGAQQDLDELYSTKALSEYLWPHTSEKDELWDRWGGMDEWGPIKGKGRTFVPDFLRILFWALLLLFYILSTILPSRTFDLACSIILGVLLSFAGTMGMFNQPLHKVRDYFGEKTAFYFAWMEHYETYLIYLSILSLFAISADASESPPVKEATTPEEIAAESRQLMSAYSKLIYCLVVATWTTVYMESWKRKNATLAYIWDVADFEEEEDPRPEFIKNFNSGIWRASKKEEEGKSWWEYVVKDMHMKEGPGFFTEDGRFVEVEAESSSAAEKQIYFPQKHRLTIFTFFAMPQLLLFTSAMIVGAASIMVFKFLVNTTDLFLNDEFWGGGFGQQIPMLLSVIWMSIMNWVYTALATWLNGLENYRTDTEYEDHLILKVMLFTFINSYITLFYIGFAKAIGYPLNLGKYGKYEDMCGFYPGNGPPAPWDGAAQGVCGVKQGCFRYAQVNPLCPSQATDCCNYDAPTLAMSGCDFIFIERDCTSDLRLMMVSYTLLKQVYEGLLQVAIPMVLTWMNKITLHKKIKQMEIEKEKERSKREGEAFSTAEEGPPPPPSSKDEELPLPPPPPPASEKVESAVPSPPPSPPEQEMTVAVKVQSDNGSSWLTKGSIAVDEMSPDEAREAFHKAIELEATHARFEGTFDEYLTKVTQFGYVSMWSPAFLIASIAGAVGNFIELRLDAIKVLQSRRRKYEGAEDIGTWRDVIVLMSWIALPVNALLLVFTSWTFRKYVIAPGIATGPCKEAEPFGFSVADSAFLLQPSGGGSLPAYQAMLSPRASFYGTNTTFYTKCEQNINDCWAPVGGVEWLPAMTYLVGPRWVDGHSPSTVRLYKALCDPESPLHHPMHCRTCQGWGNEVLFIQLCVFVIVEHILLIFKLILAYAIPDSPEWVRDAIARRDFVEARLSKRAVAKELLDPGIVAIHREELKKVEIAKIKLLLNMPTPIGGPQAGGPDPSVDRI